MKCDILVIALFAMFLLNHLPVNETYIFSVSRLKIVMAADIIIVDDYTNVNIMPQLLSYFWNPFERNKKDFSGKYETPFRFTKYTKFLQK